MKHPSRGRSTYLNLEAIKVIETIDRLRTRIAARFPDSSLLKSCGTIAEVAHKTTHRVDRARRPRLFLRTLTWLVVLCALAGMALIVYAARENVHVASNIIELTLGLDAAVSLIIVFGSATWFLVGAERRLKRKDILQALHELRSFAHVIDMHQLTKDPYMIFNPERKTDASPSHGLSAFELSRYLDYCSEMLALIGKLAALYAEHTDDGDVIDAVNDVETLTTNLSRKIWQKIILLDDMAGHAGALK